MNEEVRKTKLEIQLEKKKFSLADIKVAFSAGARFGQERGDDDGGEPDLGTWLHKAFATTDEEPEDIR